MSETTPTVSLHPAFDWPAVARLVRGEFLEGFYVHDVPEFEQWVVTERARLRRMEIGLLERLAERFHVDVQTSPPRIPYRETINGSSEGYHRQLPR